MYFQLCPISLTSQLLHFILGRGIHFCFIEMIYDHLWRAPSGTCSSPHLSFSYILFSPILAFSRRPLSRLTFTPELYIQFPSFISSTGSLSGNFKVLILWGSLTADKCMKYATWYGYHFIFLPSFIKNLSSITPYCTNLCVVISPADFLLKTYY